MTTTLSPLAVQGGPSRAEYHKQWKLKNPEKVAAGHKRYREKNKEKIRERIREYKAKRRALDPDWENRKSREWVAANRERRRQITRRHLVKRLGFPEPTRPQPDGCECCGAKQTGAKRHLDLDHCHKSGKFRGWLCNRCNLGIGQLGDSLNGLLRAVEYLRKYGDDS